MADERWRGLDDEGLERLLVERWLYRGLLLAVIVVSAVATSYVGASASGRLTDVVTIGTLLAVAVVAAVVAFLMRQQDLRMMRELRQRRGKP